MGFNKQIIGKERTLYALKNQKLNSLYYNVDSFLFDDELSLNVYKEYKHGKKEKEIITLLNIEL